MITYGRRGEFDNTQLNALHGSAQTPPAYAAAVSVLLILIIGAVVVGVVIVLAIMLVDR